MVCVVSIRSETLVFTDSEIDIGLVQDEEVVAATVDVEWDKD